jgi:hypothetical protein
MKGPKGKLNVIRRHWLCPRCGRKTWTSGQIVNLYCTCSQTLMHLLEGRNTRRSSHARIADALTPPCPPAEPASSPA